MKSLKTFVALVGGVLFIAQFAFASPVLERMEMAKAQFQEVVKATPEKKIRATAFFTNDMSLENVTLSLHGSPLVVKGFRHGTQSYSGGYYLKPGETVDEAIVNYRRDHLFFLQKRMEVENNILAAETDENLRKAVIAHQKEADQMMTDFEERGIRVIGVEFFGKAKDVQDFMDRNSFVRVLELKEDGKPQPAIVPQQ